MILDNYVIALLISLINYKVLFIFGVHNLQFDILFLWLVWDGTQILTDFSKFSLTKI